MNNHSANSYEVTERRKMQKVKLLDIIEKPLSGEWGSEAEDGNGVLVLRTTNFTNEGIINFNSVVRRDLGNKNVDKKYLKKGDIIIEKSGGSDNQPVGRVVYFEAENNKYLFNNFTSVLRAKTDIAFPKYIFYCLFYKYKIGATRPFENKTTGLHNLKLEQYINSILITLPPIEEQRAIAEKLDKVSQLVDKRKEQLQQLDQLVKSQFIDMFGDPAIDEDNGDTLGDYFNIVSGGTPDTKNMDYWQNGTIPWIGSSACQNCVIKTVNQKFITQMGLHHSSSKILGAGTVLVALVGATIGKTALLKCETAINQNIAGIKVLENKQFTPQYVFYAMQFLYKKFMEIGGDKFKMANLTFIRGLPFAKQPIVLQNKFAEFVEMVDKLKEKVNSSLTHLNLLKQSLMQQYFG